MHAVVSMLDEAHSRQVEQLWRELEQTCGVRGIYVTPFAHFSYQVAAGYDLGALEPVLAEIAAETRPFRVTTSGLGIFTGPTPVLYVPVVRTRELTQFHRRVWRRLHRIGTGVSPYYRTDNWMPHITLGYGDLTQENLPAAIRLLGARNLAWEISVENIALIHDSGTEQGLRFQFGFQG